MLEVNMEGIRKEAIVTQRHPPIELRELRNIISKTGMG
jgi:hypothetical protein